MLVAVECSGVVIFWHSSVTISSDGAATPTPALTAAGPCWACGVAEPSVASSFLRPASSGSGMQARRRDAGRRCQQPAAPGSAGLLGLSSGKGNWYHWQKLKCLPPAILYKTEKLQNKPQSEKLLFSLTLMIVAWHSCYLLYLKGLDF